MASMTPRCGDGAQLAMQVRYHSGSHWLLLWSVAVTPTLPLQLAIQERQAAAQAPLGFPRLLRGTKRLGVVLISDRGYIRALAQKYAKLGILSPKEWCERHGVAFIWPFNEDDEVGLIYDPVRHRICVVPKDQAKVRNKSQLELEETYDRQWK